MRLAGLIAAAAAVAAGGAEASQPTVAARAVIGTVPVTGLGAEAVLLEIDTTGVSRRRADYLVAQASVTGSGSTQAEAVAAARAAAERAAEAARRAGAAPTDVRILEGWDASDLLVDALLEPAEPGSAPAAERARIRLEVRLSDLRSAERLAEAMAAAGADLDSPVYRLNDEEGARREARADALARARAEAEDFAARLGLRVGRLIRVSTRTDSGSVAELLAMRDDAQVRETVVTRVSLALDYELLPRR